MPITDDEWATGQLDPKRDRPSTTTVDERDRKTALVRSFLERNADRAFTAREVRRCVAVDETDDGDPVRSKGTAEAVLDEPVEEKVADSNEGDVQAVLGDLVEAGAVVAKDIDTDDGSQTYYRLNTGREQVEG